MRFQLAVLAAALAAALAPLPSQAATWQPVVAANGDRAEVDRDRILRTGPGRTVAWTRLVLGRELRDGEGIVYTSIQAMNRYDCQGRRFATLRRVYMQGERVLREETVSSPKEMRAEPGSAEDKLLAEVCRLRPVAQADPATAEGGPGVMHADLRAATADTAARTVPVVDAKPATKVPEKSAGPAAEKAVEGSAEKPTRPRFIELPKIDKSQLEDPHKAPAPAKPQTAKAAEARVTEARNLAKSAQDAMEKPAVLSRQEIERQYATSGPRRAAPAVRKKVEPEQAVQEHKHIHWSYEGEGAPANWGKLRPDYGTCATGKRQSPIDIRDGIIKVDLEPIRFDYKHTLFRIVDNGHTVQVTVGEGSTIHVMGRSYELVQFHFHKPSEERINGRAFDMVVHLVHKDLDGNLAVIAVLLERGAEHPLIQTLWNHMPLEPDMAVEPPEAAIDLNGLLPENRNYYTYMGSLTTPPCTEGVLWMVMKQPMQVSPEQIAIFSRLYRHNARPVQPANNRLIKESR